MYNPVSGTLMHFFNLKPIQQETLMIHFLQMYQKKQKFRINNILKKLKMFIKKEVMEVQDMIVIGIQKKPKKIFLELTLLLFHQMYFDQLFMNNLLDQENSFQQIEFSETNLQMQHIQHSFIKFKDLLLIEILV